MLLEILNDQAIEHKVKEGVLLQTESIITTPTLTYLWFSDPRNFQIYSDPIKIKKSRWMLMHAPNAEKARMKWKTLPKSSNTKRGTPIPNWALDEAQAAPSQDGSVRTKERVGQCTCVSLALFNYAKVNGAGYITTHKGARAEALAGAQRESGGALRPLWYPHAVVPPSLVWRSQLVAKRLLIRSLRLRSADTDWLQRERDTQRTPPATRVNRTPSTCQGKGRSLLINFPLSDVVYLGRCRSYLLQFCLQLCIMLWFWTYLIF